MGLNRIASLVLVGTPLISAFRQVKQSSAIALCDAALVEETCALFQVEESVVTAADLSDMLSAPQPVADELFDMLGLSASGASCASLCDAVVKGLGSAAPPASDVGCIASGCSVDLSPEVVMKESRYAGDLPDFHDKDDGQLKRSDTTESYLHEVQGQRQNHQLEYTNDSFLRRVANLFRMYPAADIEVTASTGASMVEVNISSVSDQMEQVNLKAIAYTATAIRKFRQRKTKGSIRKWYGYAAYKNSATRREVSRILNSVSGMLGNVRYVYPGPQCSPNTYAYVYPRSRKCTDEQINNRYACTKDRNNKFIFFMCAYTLSVDIGEQIETLTHEGSHHASAYTDDVPTSPGSGQTAYGRRACTTLAKTYPSEALKNADNLCYYIQDVTDGI